MFRYIVRRLLQAVPVLFGITIIIFTLVELAPGDAVTAMFVPDIGIVADMDEERMQALRASYGLDKPAPVRYLKWLGAVLRGNLGKSFVTRTPVTEEIVRRLPATLKLTVTALFISLALGIPLGVITAVRQYSLLDYFATWWTYVAIALPSFFSAILLMYLFALKLDLLPTFGYSTVTRDFGFWDGLLDQLKYLILPATALGIPGVASFMRYSRSSMLEHILQDYATVARSKGLKETVVLYRHVLRNALLPVITITGLHLPELFGGALVIETIFGWPGMSILFMAGVGRRDYPLIMGIGLISTVLIVLSTLLTDLAYVVVDPRIRYE